MILLLDIGNSRLKSAWLTGAGLRTQTPVKHHGHLPTELLDCWRKEPRPGAVWVCSVGAEGLARDVEAFTGEQWQCPVTRLRPRRHQAGVVNAYHQPETLGADRWAALLGAMADGLAPCCLIDCGTAMTLDALDASGHHLGGQIVPGMNLMRQSLGQGTAGVGQQMATGDAPYFGRSTVDAVGGGVVHTCLAAIRSFHRQSAGQFAGARPRLVLTGGDAPALLDGLADLEPRHCPDLVLQGLAVAARDAGR